MNIHLVSTVLGTGSSKMCGAGAKCSNSSPTRTFATPVFPATHSTTYLRRVSCRLLFFTKFLTQTCVFIFFYECLYILLLFLFSEAFTTTATISTTTMANHDDDQPWQWRSIIVWRSTMKTNHSKHHNNHHHDKIKWEPSPQWQGWELALWFFMQVASFLPKKSKLFVFLKSELLFLLLSPF